LGAERGRWSSVGRCWVFSKDVKVVEIDQMFAACHTCTGLFQARAQGRELMLRVDE